MSTLVIAECGSSWDLDLSKAERLINAAKECDAQIAKFQWTSNADAMAKRRGHPEWADGYRKWLMYPRKWLDTLKAMCDKAGIEFAVTCYLIEDIPVVANFVKRFKVSAFESQWKEFIQAHEAYDKMIIASVNPGNAVAHRVDRALYCVSKYPTPIDDLHLREHVHEHDGMTYGCDGFSDHTANVLTGAAAVAAGAKIVEAHIRLHDTDKGNPDYGHSLIADVYELAETGVVVGLPAFAEYVRNIRTVERML